MARKAVSVEHARVRGEHFAGGAAGLSSASQAASAARAAA